MLFCNKIPFICVLFVLSIGLVFAEDKPAYEIPEKLSAEEMKDAPVFTNAVVYPEWGVPCTNFSYLATYKDEKGRPPVYVRVWLNGQWHNMKKTEGDDFVRGVTYSYNYIPTSGKSNFYYYEASNGVGKARGAIIDSPNQGPMIYSQKFDNNEIILLKKGSSTPLWNFETGYDMTSDVAVSKDGRYVAAATATHIYLFSTGSNKPLWSFCTDCEELKMGRSNYGGIAISADGSYVAASINSNLYFFEKGSNEPVWHAEIESNAIGIDMSDNGNYVAVGVGNAGKQGDKFFLFNKEGEKLFEYKAQHSEYEQTGNFYRPDMTPDGKYTAVSTGCPDRRAYLFSNEPKLVFRSDQLTQDSPVHKSAISNDASIIAYSLDHMSGKPLLYVFDKQGKLLWSFSNLEDATARAVSVSGDGKYIAIGTMGGNIYFFSKDSNKPLWSHSIGQQYAKVGDVKLSSAGDFLVAGSTTKNVYLFSYTDSDPVWEYTANTWVNAVDFNGEYIIAGTGMLEYAFEGNDVSEKEVSCTSIIQPPPQESFDLGMGNANAYCGNGICEPDGGENKESCTADCMLFDDHNDGPVNDPVIESVDDFDGVQQPEEPVNKNVSPPAMNQTKSPGVVQNPFPTQNTTDNTGQQGGLCLQALILAFVFVFTCQISRERIF